jgi:D-alanyl-D-alanine carboxypeptidase
VPTRTSTVLAASLALAVAAGPSAAPAFAASAATSPSARVATATGPDTDALRAAVAGLPDADATSAAIRVGGDGTWRGTAGVRDVRTGAPALENGRFRAGSVTKVVTASIVLQLAAEGRIDLDGTVQRYLPGLLTREFRPITVRELLNYTSGLRPGASLGDTV